MFVLTVIFSICKYQISFYLIAFSKYCNHQVANQLFIAFGLLELLTSLTQIIKAVRVRTEFCSSQG